VDYTAKMVRIAMKNVNKRVEPEVSPAKAGLLSIDPKLVLHSSDCKKVFGLLRIFCCSVV